ncbi:hypothetical protein LTS18_001461, partial [Coniosporium uncinatum]
MSAFDRPGESWFSWLYKLSTLGLFTFKPSLITKSEGPNNVRRERLRDRKLDIWRISDESRSDSVNITREMIGKDIIIFRAPGVKEAEDTVDIEHPLSDQIEPTSEPAPQQYDNTFPFVLGKDSGKRYKKATVRVPPTIQR